MIVWLPPLISESEAVSMVHDLSARELLTPSDTNVYLGKSSQSKRLSTSYFLQQYGVEGLAVRYHDIWHLS